jgi:hypothetical protein
MPKVFLSHASEDKALVEQVYLRLLNRFPDLRPWLDKYEILGGDDLIETIHKGISESEKFLIFLSPNSIDKPWVRTELKKALIDEISGSKPNFIVPIKCGHITQFPPFLEGRLYIDLEKKTEEEWLEEIYAAVFRQPKQLGDNEPNLQIAVTFASDIENTAVVVMESRFWSEPIGLRIKTNSAISEARWILRGPKGPHMVGESILRLSNEYGVAITSHKLQPKWQFLVLITFLEGGDPRGRITEIQPWDGSGGNMTNKSLQFS